MRVSGINKEPLRLSNDDAQWKDGSDRMPCDRSDQDAIALSHLELEFKSCFLIVNQDNRTTPSKASRCDQH